MPYTQINLSLDGYIILNNLVKIHSNKNQFTRSKNKEKISSSWVELILFKTKNMNKEGRHMPIFFFFVPFVF